MHPTKLSAVDSTWRRIGKWLALLLALIFVVACAKAAPRSSTGITDIQVTNGAKALPTPLKPFVFKTSQPNTATLQGKLVVLDPATLPEQGDSIFLAPIDQSNPGVSTVPQFTKGQVPQAEVDEGTGEFVFTDIKPGVYMVMIITMGQAQIPAHTYDAARNLVVVKVDETFLNKTTDIGTMSLP